MKGRRLVIVSVILLGLSGILRLCAVYLDGFADSYVADFYPFLVGTIGRVMSCFPFSVGELGLYGLLIFFVGLIIVSIVKKKILKGLSILLLVSSILVFSFTIGCGINYQHTGFAKMNHFDVKPRETETLVELFNYLIDELNKRESEVFSVDDIRSAMSGLGEEYGCLSGYYPVPKALSVPYILEIQQVEGIYSPFTFEANYNGNLPDADLPVVMCHELAHLKGFMKEEEANFIAYLACVNSHHKGLQYSGYLLAYKYVANALAKVDYESYLELRSKLNETVVQDLNRYYEYWRQFDGPVSEFQDHMNDVYLKSNGQSAGVESYGMMVDLLLAYYAK